MTRWIRSAVLVLALIVGAVALFTEHDAAGASVVVGVASAVAAGAVALGRRRSE